MLAGFGRPWTGLEFIGFTVHTVRHGCVAWSARSGLCIAADQTRESDLHFFTRLAKKHDAVATVKKGRLVFKPIGSTIATTGDELETITITRADGDQHRYHSADRNAYSVCAPTGTTRTRPRKRACWWARKTTKSA